MSSPETAVAIDTGTGYRRWAALCPDARRLARNAAVLALREGAAAAGIVLAAPVELSVVLVGDREQRRLNREWRGVDRATNVLAFPAWQSDCRTPPGAPVLLGDITLAAETVAREAAEQQKPPADHLCHLVVHGVLHLLGYDHLTDAEAAVMERLERAVLAQLGVADPYRGTI